MYKFSKNIRIRQCDELSFFINITNNYIYTINTETLKFLEKKIGEGLSIEKINDNIDFLKFIRTLEMHKILEFVYES